MFWSPFFTPTVIFVSFRKGRRERGRGQTDGQTDRQTVFVTLSILQFQLTEKSF